MWAPKWPCWRVGACAVAAVQCAVCSGLVAVHTPRPRTTRRRHGGSGHGAAASRRTAGWRLRRVRHAACTPCSGCRQTTHTRPCGHCTRTATHCTHCAVPHSAVPQSQRRSRGAHPTRRRHCHCHKPPRPRVKDCPVCGTRTATMSIRMIVEHQKSLASCTKHFPSTSTNVCANPYSSSVSLLSITEPIILKHTAACVLE